MSKNPLNVFSEYLQALVFALFLAILIRSFVFEPFKIPTPSMVPTLLVGDNIFVKRYAYGLRVPFTKIWLTEFDDPKRGDVVVFTEPENEREDYIKRVVGLPGDHIQMKAGVLSINGQEITESLLKTGERKLNDSCELTLLNSETNAPFTPFPYYADRDEYDVKSEFFSEKDVPHLIQTSQSNPRRMSFEYVVPERHYFVMGDNRDNSKDSRFIGAIPRENLKGKAERIWLSMNAEGGACPADVYYGWIGPLIDFIVSPLGLEPFGSDFWPSVRWDRFGRKIL